MYSLKTVLDAHYHWRNTLTETLLTGAKFTGSLDPVSCTLGKWMVSEDISALNDPVIKKHLDQLRTPHANMHNFTRNIVEMVDAGESERAVKDFVTTIVPIFYVVIGEMTAINDRFITLINMQEAAIISEASVYVSIIVTLLIIITIICVALSILISKAIVNEINFFAKVMAVLANTGNFDIDSESEHKIADLSTRKGAIGQISTSFNSLVQMIKAKLQTLQEVANSNLAVDIVLRSENDSYGRAFVKMVDELNHLFVNIQSSTEIVSSSSRQIADGAQSLASGSTQQAATLQHLSGTISDISDKTKKNAERTNSASNLANTIMQNAEKGNQQMEQMINAVNEIDQANQNISKIIKVIDEIAFQTNILALNAAVEAARAGSAGKGFAVVAEEVRNLAAKSAESAKDTSNIIENSIKKTQLGTKIAGQTAESLKEIVAGISESNKIITEIAQSSEEQFNSISLITSAIGEVAQVTQQNAAMAQQSAAASQEMSGQANILENMIAQIQLKKQNERLALH